MTGTGPDAGQGARPDPATSPCRQQHRDPPKLAPHHHSDAPLLEYLRSSRLTHRL